MKSHFDDDAALGCAVGARIGDQMGSPTEGLEPSDIAARFGWLDRFEAGPGTDDTILSRLLCQSLVDTNGMATADDWANTWLPARKTTFVEYRNRFFPSVLYVADRLARGDSPREVSSGSMPSSSSAMAIWPVGVVNPGRPHLAAMQAEDIASLIHTRDLGFCQDAAVVVAAAVSLGVGSALGVEDIVREAISVLKPTSGRQMRNLIIDALELADHSNDYESFRASYRDRFRREIQCDARETVPAAIALCVLSGGDFERAVEFAVNFGRDTDTIACMVGAIMGAVGGLSAIPNAWIRMLGEQDLDEERALIEGLRKAAASRIRTLVGCDHANSDE